MGDLPLAGALRSQAVQLIGAAHLSRSFSRWFALSAVAGTPRPEVGDRVKDRRLTKNG
jgi:hypothetical protein